MITAGVDVGIENVKVVVLKDGKVVARAMALSGGAHRAKAAEQVWQEGLSATGLKASDVSKVIATGQGKYDVRFAAGNVVEPVADARAALFLYPSARSVVEIGADQVRVVTLDDKGGIQEVVLNQKCGAGIGTFLRTIARTMGMTVAEMGNLAGDSQATVSDSCAVFAELDAIRLLQNNTPIPTVVLAINEAIATRLNMVLNDKIRPEKDTSVLFGGVARNRGVITALKKRSGINFMIPEQPEFACALGAALLATE